MLLQFPVRLDRKYRPMPNEPGAGADFKRYMSLKGGWTIIGRIIETMRTESLRTVEQLKGFLDRNVEVDLKPEDREADYGSSDARYAEMYNMSSAVRLLRMGVMIGLTREPCLTSHNWRMV